MKAMVLAAGLGLRMRPLTLLRAKPILPVLNRPLLHRTLRHLARAGVREVVINLHHLPGTVTRAVGDGRFFGLRIRYSREREILGTGGGPRKVRAFFGDDPFLLVNGDVLFDFDLRALVRRHRARGALATLALRPNPDPERYGPVVTDRGGVVRWLPGARPPRRRGTVSLFTGVHVMDPSLLDRLPAGRPADSVRDLYAPLLSTGRIHGVRTPGRWLDLGEPRLYLLAQLRLLAGAARSSRGRALVDPRARVGEGARVDRSVVGEGAVIGRDAVVARSVLWSGARIGDGARVDGSIVTDRGVVRAGERVRGAIVLARGRASLRT
jgi:NDP-sugar pyrophosphorylase family protein